MNAPDREEMLDALGHGYCVPRKFHKQTIAAQEDAELRAERAERERDEALRRLDEAHLARIEAQNPGIDMERVRRDRAALSADADADAVPEPWKHLRIPHEGDTATAGELTIATEHPAGTCAMCDTEPSRAEGDECTCVPDGDLHRAHCPLSLYRQVRTEADAEGGRPREADPQGPSPGNGDASVDGGGDEQPHRYWCGWCGNWLPSCWWDPDTNHECVHACTRGPTRREDHFHAKAGGSDKAEDGRARAIESAVEPLRREFSPPVSISSAKRWAATVIDAALDSGGVRLTDPGEPDVSVEAYWAVSEGRDKAEARAREMERKCRMLAQRLLAKDETLTREERERLSGMAGRNDWSRS